jgi:hypothetical protein
MFFCSVAVWPPSDPSFRTGRQIAGAPLRRYAPAMRSAWVVGAVVATLVVWAAASAQSPLKRDSVIDLVYLGGPDCPYCRAWEAKELPRLRGMEEFRHIRFTHVLKKIKEPVPELGRLPDYLKPMRDQMVRQMKGRGGSPQFVLLLDGVAVHGGFGTQAYHALMPTVTELVTRKTGRKMPVAEP